MKCQTLLVRMISFSKWRQCTENPNFKAEDLCADTVTSDLRTRNNTLSNWIITNINNMDDAVLVLASERQRLEKLDLLWYEYEENKLKFVTRSTPSQTIIEDMRDKHVDIVNLNYGKLRNVIICFIEAITENHYKTFSKKEVKNILLNAIKDNRLDINKLYPKVKEELQK